ncbi:YdcF family protein [Rhodanobacter sp. B04]|uniref:YdcF family protein n=1 Tax=Rhodanobacter sp. B04 TaxID=1945860 RepID=UPI00157DE906|nr:YdcF family protein [Rhodanobacter sp. B04]
MPVPSNLASRSPWRYLRDRDIQHAAAVTVLALLLSGGLVWLGYLIRVCRVAARSPLAPPRRMIALVFGRRLEHDRPEQDYQLRLQRVLTLAQQQQADHVLLLGGCSGGQCSEAVAGHAWLQQHGLAADVRVELEQDSVDSLENLRHARRLLQAHTGQAGLPPVALVTSRYHLARCLLLARRLGFDGQPVAAEAELPWHARYLGLLLIEAAYLMWIDLGLRWAQLIGHRRMRARIS